MAIFIDFQAFFLLCILCFYCTRFVFVEANNDRKDYIVYMGTKTNDYSLTSYHYLNTLQYVLDESTPEESLIISYGRSFNGFAARLTLNETERLQSMPRVVSIFPSRKLQLQTTRSWDFLGLPQAILGDPTALSESNIIVGLIDTGIWPESPSFNDTGFGPVTKKWKGVCQGGINFTCNNKIIGARAYTTKAKEVRSARDRDGHGSHTASIAAGRAVSNASFYGLANGIARGGSPFARIAVYKACDASGCSESLLLAAFDDAIADGVDLISISAGKTPMDFNVDGIAIGSFHAMAKGILTVQSAGNNGNVSGFVGGIAPWVFSVAASSTDRRIVDKLVLGDGTTLTGSNVNTFALKGDRDDFPIVSSDLTSSTQQDESHETRLNVAESSLKGKIVVTESDSKKSLGLLLDAGAIGAVTMTRRPDVSFIVPMPSVALASKDYEAILPYVVNGSNPRATILESEAITDTSAPVVPSFSSRGPNRIAKDILKPDITAPGVDILAAYSPDAPVTEFDSDKRSVMYSIITGTSMACPHVAGAAAYLKSIHPDWSPAAIKSALMTTALPMSRLKNADGEFAYGAGHLNPVKAANPGLVYETTRDDYITFMCNLGYTLEAMKPIVGNDSFSCPKQGVLHSSPIDVNYPTMSTMVDPGKPFKVTFSRVVSNVGVATSTYTAKVESEQKITVTVEPNSLTFRSLKEQKSFNVTVVGDGLTPTSSTSASLIWSDGTHSVRSPIVVYCE